jgi:hypothetical protein
MMFGLVWGQSVQLLTMLGRAFPLLFVCVCCACLPACLPAVRHCFDATLSLLVWHLSHLSHVPARLLPCSAPLL